MRSVVAMPIPFDKVLRARISLIQPVIQQGDKTGANTDSSEFAHTKQKGVSRMAGRLFRRSYGSLQFSCIKEVTCAVRRSSIAIADMAIATRLHESARTYLSALLLCAMVCLLVACGSSGSGGGGQSAASAGPNTAMLTWDAVPVPDVGGYRVYYGTAPGTYSQSFGRGLNTGNVTTYEVMGLSSGTRYYIYSRRYTNRIT